MLFKANVSQSKNQRVWSVSGELLPSGDRREVEIRGCSIWSVELIKERLHKMVQETDGNVCNINSAIIDFYLWPFAKQHHKEMAHIPIHHTRCIYYWQTASRTYRMFPAYWWLSLRRNQTWWWFYEAIVSVQLMTMFAQQICCINHPVLAKQVITLCYYIMHVL